MKEEYRRMLDDTGKKKVEIIKKITALKSMRKGAVDGIVHQFHEEVFNEIDCLECANCCKTTGPMLNMKDIDKISKYLKISGTKFIEKYLKIDEDNDYVFKTMPCPFLGTDKYCSIYEVRPKACREYPHTDRANQVGILTLTEKNALVCPAVAEIFNRLP